MPLVFPEPDQLQDMDAFEQAAVASLAHWEEKGSGYFKQQSTRPQTLGYGLADSPVGQAAWIYEKMWAWTDNQGNLEDALTLDESFGFALILVVRDDVDQVPPCRRKDIRQQKVHSCRPWRRRSLWRRVQYGLMSVAVSRSSRP
jgi:hypothetical protein